MFNVEESIKHLKEMRYQVILMKDGQSEEGLPPLDLEEENKQELLLKKSKQKEINA